MKNVFSLRVWKPEEIRKEVNASIIVVLLVVVLFSSIFLAPYHAQALLRLRPSQGWESLELFAPSSYRDSEDPNKRHFIIQNRRDMWYLVKVYKRNGGGPWLEIFPFATDLLPNRIASYWTKSFSDFPQDGDQYKIEVINDLNDDLLWKLYVFDFVTRALLGGSIAPAITTFDEWKTTLFRTYANNAY